MTRINLINPHYRKPVRIYRDKDWLMHGIIGIAGFWVGVLVVVWVR